MHRVFFHRRALAETFRSNDEHKTIRWDHVHRGDLVPLVQLDAVHATRHATLHGYVLFLEAQRLTLLRHENQLAIAMRQPRPTEFVAFVQIQRGDATCADAVEFGERRALDTSSRGCHRQEFRGGEIGNGYGRCDAFIRLEGQEIIERQALWLAFHLRHLMSAQWIDFAAIRKEKQRITRVGREEILDGIFFARLHAL